MLVDAARNRAKLSHNQASGFKLDTLRLYKIGYICRAAERALMLAAQNGHGQVVRALLDRGADPNLAQGGNTALIAASL